MSASELNLRRRHTIFADICWDGSIFRIDCLVAVCQPLIKLLLTYLLTYLLTRQERTEYETKISFRSLLECVKMQLLAASFCWDGSDLESARERTALLLSSLSQRPRHLDLAAQPHDSQFYFPNIGKYGKRSIAPPPGQLIPVPYVVLYVFFLSKISLLLYRYQ